MWLRLSGTLLVVLLAYLFLSVVEPSLKPFEYAVFPIEDSLASTEKGIAYGVSYALWDQRSLDLVILALLLFAASACCASVLNPHKDKKWENV
jgi:hypothetical protein